MANETSEALKKYIYARVRLGFDIYDRLKLKGVELIDVKNALNTTRDKWLFELIDSVRVF